MQYTLLEEILDTNSITFYETIDVYPEGTPVLYSPRGLGGFSGGGIKSGGFKSRGFGGSPRFPKPFKAYKSGLEFHPSNRYGVGGGGIARKILGTSGSLIERYKYDNHPPLGPHINFHNIVPYNTRKRPILDNIHIPYIPKSTFSYLKRINRSLPKSFRFP